VGLRRRIAQPAVIDPVRPNAGLEVWYRNKLMRAIDEMQRSLVHFVERAYRGNPPETLAEDESPAVALQRVIRKLSQRWQREFDRLAKRLGPEFTKKAGRHTDQAFAERLKKAGFTVRFRMSREVNDVTQASVAENVQLIRSIAEQHLGQVEGLVMRSVQEGRNLGELSRELQARYGVTRRRAALIARDQNNKATGAIARARQIELGITQARWVHSTAGKEPRPSHVKMDGKIFDVAKGMWDEDEGKWIQPGQLINCRCVSRPIIEGFS
jgi:SPP1 gp7 family putative phage head morphogenesis protein